MNQNSKNILSVGLGLTIIILSNINGHINPPFSIFLTPILLTIIIAGINNPLYKTNFNLTVFYNFGLLLFNDLLIRFYAGGTHDDEGKGWIFLFFAVAFILSIISMTVYAFTTIQTTDKEIKKKNIRRNIVTIVLSAIITGLIYSFIIADI